MHPHITTILHRQGFHVVSLAIGHWLVVSSRLTHRTDTSSAANEVDDRIILWSDDCNTNNGFARNEKCCGWCWVDTFWNRRILRTCACVFAFLLERGSCSCDNLRTLIWITWPNFCVGTLRARKFPSSIRWSIHSLQFSGNGRWTDDYSNGYPSTANSTVLFTGYLLQSQTGTSSKYAHTIPTLQPFRNKYAHTYINTQSSAIQKKVGQRLWTYSLPAQKIFKIHTR